MHNILIHQFGVSGPVINWMICSQTVKRPNLKPAITPTLYEQRALVLVSGFC